MFSKSPTCGLSASGYRCIYGMAKVFAPFRISRTMCGLTFYMVGDANLVRKKSSLSCRRVLTSPQFARTRQFAGLMARASKIGSAVYNALPEYWRQFWMYRAFTGEAMTMLKDGRCEEEIREVLFKIYVNEVGGKKYEVGSKMYEVGCKRGEKRAYRKKDTVYWNNKTRKANRRKARRELTLHYAGMLATASRIASVVYRNLNKRKYGMYQALTGLAIRMLKDGLEEDVVKEILMREAGGWCEVRGKTYGVGSKKSNAEDVAQANKKKIKCRIIRSDGRCLYCISTNIRKESRYFEGGNPLRRSAPV